MLYQECIQFLVLRDVFALGALFLGLLISVALAARAKRRAAFILVLFAAVVCASRMYLLYELNCVELL
jgi:hypothetical protein